MKASIISVKEARKQLGAQYRDLPDDCIEQIISLLSKIAAQSMKSDSSTFSF